MSSEQQTDSDKLMKFHQNQALKSKRGSFSSWKGNKYPQVKLRGFYSDVTSQQNSDKNQVICHYFSYIIHY